jgi:biopolymer transport protein TolR
MADTSDDNGGAISAINVTPLVDVMLVLLVIFMVTTPMMQQGVSVDLPTASGAPLPHDESAFVVTVTADGHTFLNDSELDLGALVDELHAIEQEKPGTLVYLRADHDATYGTVVGVMAALKAAGVERLGMMTDPAGA